MFDMNFKAETGASMNVSEHEDIDELTRVYEKLGFSPDAAIEKAVNNVDENAE